MECIIRDQVNEVTKDLINLLKEKSDVLKLQDSVLYHKYPYFLDDEGEILEPDILIISKQGILVIWIIDEIKIDSDRILELCEIIEQVTITIQSKLMINRTLRSLKKEVINYMDEPRIYAPLLTENIEVEYSSFRNEESLIESIKQVNNDSETYSDLEYQELRATLEGSKPLKKKKKRANVSEKSKGYIANELEKKIALFDRRQRIFFSKDIEGPTRIRGLAGSGKTIMLTMKAAMIHLSDPNADIIYTFWTKSLYQQIKQWITNFYGQYSNGRKPNWEKLQVLHGWGSKQKDGFYRNTCISNRITPLSFYDVKDYSYPFDEACKRLLKNINLTPKYDYILIDEGQDFPASFIQICNFLSKENKFVLAYDDQQSIFQSKAPNPGDIFGFDENQKPKRNFMVDLILHKVYRNPREVLICAHALGFGIYGEIVQVIEDMAYWEDIGYVVKEGAPISNSLIKVERPEKNSLSFISSNYKPEEIIRVEVCENLDQEIKRLVHLIKEDINNEKLDPDDILVIAVNDFTARLVLQKVSEALENENILCNDIHSDPLNIMNFFIKDRVTLSTIHKAKGNEAFSVYIICVDILFQNTNLTKRNKLFTGITRSKAWVTLMGEGEYAEKCRKEIEEALKNFPTLTFKYPDEEEIKRIKRELSFDSAQKMKMYRLMEELLFKYGDNLSDAEIESIFKDFIKTRKKNE